jgi:death-on-curing protein
LPISLSEPYWLNADELSDLNEQIVEGSGEPFAIIKPNELESAAERPRSLYLYENVDDIGCLAVRLMVAICQNHPFAEGNKRTGFIAATIFVEDNGYVYDAEDDTAFAELLKAVITGDASENDLIAAFRAGLIKAA